MFKSTKLPELTAGDIEMYLRKVKQRALVKAKDGFVEKQVLKASGIASAAANAERGDPQEVPVCESMRRRRVSGARRRAIPAALRNPVGTADDRVRGAGIPAQCYPYRNRNWITHRQRADIKVSGPPSH